MVNGSRYVLLHPYGGCCVGRALVGNRRFVPNRRTMPYMGDSSGMNRFRLGYYFIEFGMGLWGKGRAEFRAEIRAALNKPEPDDYTRRLAEVEKQYGTRPRIPVGHGEPLAKKHWRGELSDGQKFVYCPIGFIASWLADDYDHKWCPWCKKYFTELDK